MFRVTALQVLDPPIIESSDKRYKLFDGSNRKILGDFEFVRMNDNYLYDNNDNELLHYFDYVWFDEQGNGWYDWTVESL